MLQQKRFLPAIPLLALLLACEDPLALGDPAFIGVIREVVDQGDWGISFDVDIDETITWRSHIARLSVVADTQIVVEQPDGLPRRGERGDLAVGTTIRVWEDRNTFHRTVFPPTATALRVEVLQQEAGQ